jgi:NTE family protein
LRITRAAEAQRHALPERGPSAAGGGTLGPYQAGVYEALAERGVEPTWPAGISIGTVNSAIISGNAPVEPPPSRPTYKYEV